MIVTAMSFKNFRLQLAADWREGCPKLVSIDWLEADEPWQQLLPLKRVIKHFGIDESAIEFITENSLSKNEPLQNILITAIAQLNQYAEGTPIQFKLALDTSIGTEFQQKVWQELQKIGYGETISYAQLAANIGQPTAYRAVANANGKNPFSIVIPCHRVIASDGGLGGYTGGLSKKRLLLSLEAGIEKFQVNNG